MIGGDVFVYADETGNLDYDGAGKDGASDYFGFGTAIFEGNHSLEMWDGHVLRSTLAGRGFDMSQGFHAKNDRWDIRNPMFALLADQEPRIDTTFLLKSGAYDYVRARGEMYLYKLAWYFHLKYLCEAVLEPNAHLYVVIGTVSTRARRTAAEAAVRDVVEQMSQDITLCVWPASTSWGLQVADYALWAVHRALRGDPLKNYDETVKPLVKSVFKPWGRA